jgi:hypothetical protein
LRRPRRHRTSTRCRWPRCCRSSLFAQAVWFGVVCAAPARDGTLYAGLQHDRHHAAQSKWHPAEPLRLRRRLRLQPSSGPWPSSPPPPCTALAACAELRKKSPQRDRLFQYRPTQYYVAGTKLCTRCHALWPSPKQTSHAETRAGYTIPDPKFRRTAPPAMVSIVSYPQAPRIPCYREH